MTIQTLRLATTLLAILFLVPVHTAYRAAQASGAAYYVATTGSDANPGSIDAPFRTIQQCANVAVAGDVCYIRAGVYRETIVPANSGTTTSPITFTAYNGEDVTISGTDVVSNWTSSNGSIYTAAMPWTVFDPAAGRPISSDQIFVDGQMMNEARWPNIAIGGQTAIRRSDLIRVESATIINDYQAQYTSSTLEAFPADYWKGAKINFFPGYGISPNTCDISGNAGNTITFTCLRNTFDAKDTRHRPSAGDAFYCWGKKEALDAKGEWFRESNGTLSLMLAAGSPAEHLIEAKKRLWAFDLSGKLHIHLTHIKIFAASVKMNSKTANTVLSNIDARYIWHFNTFRLPAPYEDGNKYPMFAQGGIVMEGQNNLITDSSIAYSAASGVMVYGKQNHVTNSVIHNIGYMGGSDGIGGFSYDPGSKNEIRQNTIFNLGRVGVQLGQSMDVLLNDVYNSHLQITDLGVVYGFAVDGKGSDIAYNVVHDATAEYDSNLRHWGSFGIYLDDDTYNFTVYRNVVWNTTNHGLSTMGTNGMFITPNYPSDTPSNRKIYNNTVDGTISVQLKTYTTPVERLIGTEFKNNLATRLSISNSDVVSSANIANTGMWVDRANHDYTLRDGAGAIDAGVVLPPYTNKYVGKAPDIGFVEYTQQQPVAGAVLRPTDIDTTRITCTLASNKSTASCTISDLPVGRTLPDDFQIRVGDASPLQGCRAQMNYSTHTAQAVCDSIALGGQDGIQPVFVYVQGNWYKTDAVVDFGVYGSNTKQPEVKSVAPDKGSQRGGFQVTLQGNSFDLNPSVFRRTINIANTSGKNLDNYAVRVEFDSASLIAQGKMRSDCGDVRFSDQYTTLSYWIESGCNTSTTRVWVNVVAVPASASSIMMTYGNLLLTSASDGLSTFMFFDDFDDGLHSSNWITTDGDGVRVEEVNGSMHIVGTSTDATKYSPYGFHISDVNNITPPPSFAIDSTFSVNNGSAVVPFKAITGGSDSIIGLFSSSATDRRVGYWNGSAFVEIGNSKLDQQTFANQHVSVGYTSDNKVFYFENDEMLATRSGLANQYYGTFSYAPNAANVSFDVAFDNVRIRPFVYPEPTSTVGAESIVHQGVQVTIGGQACTAVVVQTEQSLQCIVPPGAVGVADIKVTNPNASIGTLANGFTYYKESLSVFLPMVRR